MMGSLLAIDPGPIESAWVYIDLDTFRPARPDGLRAIGKEPNALVRARIRSQPAVPVVIEMVASYGMPVGAEVFSTCVEIGRFVEAARDNAGPVRLAFRRAVKLHHCGTSTAKDSNVIQALVDRFASGQHNKGKGTKANPGFFHGFSKDIWQAYALAVYAGEVDA
jgi:hypothetical protein